ncbi:MAG: hypothetical protein IH621_05845 [Krumholzibacteria bacterium]|nr:hypothetical protein [Candidatus Krumholzibacteria bacterium]
MRSLIVLAVLLSAWLSQAAPVFPDNADGVAAIEAPAGALGQPYVFVLMTDGSMWFHALGYDSNLTDPWWNLIDTGYLPPLPLSVSQLVDWRSTGFTTLNGEHYVLKQGNELFQNHWVRIGQNAEELPPPPTNPVLGAPSGIGDLKALFR